MYHKALGIRRELLGGHPGEANLFEAIAELLLAEGKIAEAETSARQCLAVRGKRLPEGWPEACWPPHCWGTRNTP